MSELKFVVDVDSKAAEERQKAVDENFNTIARDAGKAGKVIDEAMGKAGSATNSLGGALGAAGKGLDDASNRAVRARGNFDGLSYSVQQVARELPNAAISPQLFIMAISNNLPILADNIARVRAENAALSASGQVAVPVWKQVASSIFSWQTGLVLGITALLMWGDKIPGLLSDLFKMKDGFALTSAELKTLNETFAKSAGTELGKLQMLFNNLDTATEGTQKYADAKGAIIDQYGKYLEGMDSEIISLNNVQGAYESLTKAIYDNAKAKSLEKLNADLGQTLAEETTKRREAIYKQLTDKYGENMGQVYYKAIVDALQSGKEMSYDIQRVIASFEKEIYTQQGTSSSGAVIGAGFVKINPLADSVKAFAKAQDEFNAKTKEGKQYFDILYGSDSSGKVDSLLKIQRNLLAEAKLLPETTEEEVRAKNKKIEAIENEIKRLQELGKTQKNVSADDELKKAKEQLTNAIVKNDKEEIKYLAIKVSLLEKEKELREWIAYEATAFAKGDITQAERDAGTNPTSIVAKGISPILRKGNVGIDSKGRMIEITAIDKTGPTFKKVAAEFDKLNKLQKDKAKDADKQQEKLDKDNLKRKDDLYERILDNSRQFTGQLIDQMGLTEKQNAELQSIADTVYNLAKGDYVAAGFSAASYILSAVFANTNRPDETTKALENVNNLLEKQSAILSNLSGSSYFDLAAKQYDDLGKAIELNNKKLRDTAVLTKEEYTTARELWDKKSPRAKALQPFEEYIKTIKSVTDTWDPEQFIEAFAKGALSVNDQQIEWIKSITESQKQRAELLQETFRTALGFDASSVSDSIVQGIQDGLSLAADNSLGGFAKSFGELVKTALVKNITEALNIRITEGFLTDFNKYMEDNTLTDTERKALESEFAAAVAATNAQWEAIKPILDQYGITQSGNGPMTGIASSATEDTVSAMVGQMMALRVDTKQIGVDIRTVLNFSQNQLELMDQQLSVLNQIARNTSHNSVLPEIYSELKIMNDSIKKLQ